MAGAGSAEREQAECRSAHDVASASQVVTLTAGEHFERLRGAVWARCRARNGHLAYERFEDAYAEWWAREAERAAAGRAARVSAPVAYVAEGVQRFLIDDARARARGLARGEKGALRIAHLDTLADAAGLDDTEAQGRYEALVHALLAVVRDRLSARELQVFVSTSLYLRATPETASILGLSVPRVKKDRARIARKVGDEVWRLLADELELCRPAGAADPLAAFEVLTDHVEDCPACARSFAGLRSGAVAVVGPLELVLLAGAGPAQSLLDSLQARVLGLADRCASAIAGMPPAGRLASAAAAAAVAAGGGAAIGPTDRAPSPSPDRHARAVSPQGPVTSVRPATAVPPGRAEPLAGRQSVPRRPDRPSAREQRRGASRAGDGRRRAARTPEAEGVPRVVTSSPEPAAMSPPTTAATPPAAAVAPPNPAPSIDRSPAGDPGEFGFERR